MIKFNKKLKNNLNFKLKKNYLLKSYINIIIIK